MSSPWQINSVSELLHTPVFRVKLEKAVCPRNGKTGSFYVFDIPDWVNTVALTTSHEIVMIRQYRHGTKTFEYEIPGGLIDPEDESPVAAGMRELLEETGFAGESPFLMRSVNPNPAIQNNLCHTVFTSNARRASGTALEDGEDIETILLDIEKVRGMVHTGEIRHSLVLNALEHFFYLYDRGDIA